jgi:hypothetical protein
MSISVAGCIYCGSTEFDREHGLSRCLGNFKGYEPLTDRVCRGCNGGFKQLDEQLCRSGGEAFFRQYLGIKGRSGNEKANSFYRGSAGGKRIELEAVSPEDGKPIALELSEGAVRELRHVSIVDDNGHRHVIPIQDQMTPERFRSRFDNLGVTSIKEARVYADDNEVEWIRSLVATLGPDMTLQWDDQQPPPVTYSGALITFTITARYFRAIAKIAFHCFLFMVPRFRGDEECFREIREFIKTEGNLDSCDRFVSTAIRTTIYGGHRPANWGHLVTAEIDYWKLTSRVQLFLGPESRPALFTVNLGRNPSSLIYKQEEVRYFEFYPQDQRREFDGEMKMGFAVRRIL